MILISWLGGIKSELITFSPLSHFPSSQPLFVSIYLENGMSPFQRTSSPSKVISRQILIFNLPFNPKVSKQKTNRPSLLDLLNLSHASPGIGTSSVIIINLLRMNPNPLHAIPALLFQLLSLLVCFPSAKFHQRYKWRHNDRSLSPFFNIPVLRPRYLQSLPSHSLACNSSLWIILEENKADNSRQQVT